MFRKAEVVPLPVSRNGLVWMDIQSWVGGYPVKVSHSVVLNIVGDARGQLVEGFFGSN